MKLAFFATALLISQPAVAQMAVPTEQLSQQDRRLTALAERMFITNASLCRELMPITGLILHSRDQYSRVEAEARFGGDLLAIDQVLPGSAADQAGYFSGDVIVSIGGTDPADMWIEKDGLLRDVAFAAVADGGQIVVRRAGARLALPLTAPRGCRGIVEIRLMDKFAARSDGRFIQIDYGVMTRTDDAALAVVFAHEFAHLVLEHRRRLQQAGVVKGFFGEFGRNARLARQMEVEADLLSLHLLANSGFDPASAPAFWRSDLGRKISGGLLRSRAYPSAEARAGAMEHEISNHLASGTSDGADHLLTLRDNPPEKSQ